MAVKVLFRDERLHGRGKEEKIEQAVKYLEEDIRDCLDWIKRWPREKGVYIELALNIAEDRGEYYLVMTNADVLDNIWIEWESGITLRDDINSPWVSETVADVELE